MGFDFNTAKPTMNTELRVMMAKLWLQSNQTKLTAIPRDIFIAANRDETSHVNENYIIPAEPLGWKGCSRVVFSHINTP